MDLESLIDEPSKLPTIPKVGQQLIASFSSDDVSVGEIGHQLAADPALSAELLKLANSAYFHVPHTIGTVDAALQMLGLVVVRNLVLGNSVYSLGLLGSLGATTFIRPAPHAGWRAARMSIQTGFSPWRCCTPSGNCKCTPSPRRLWPRWISR